MGSNTASGKLDASMTLEAFKNLSFLWKEAIHRVVGEWLVSGREGNSDNQPMWKRFAMYDGE